MRLCLNQEALTREPSNGGLKMKDKMTGNQKAALERIIEIAQGDTGQSRRVANFLLAWWNPAQCGGFDLTDIRAVDDAIAADMLTIFALAGGVPQLPG